jgi:RNA polymerase sigma-70 factor (ECF subfamily)
MLPRNMTLSEVDRLALDAEQAGAFHMTEEAFRTFYERTARPLWAYLARATGEPHTADDLLQETYYRFLRAAAVLEDDGHRRNYLFRIATNLVRDRHRRPSREVPMPEEGAGGGMPCENGAPTRFAAHRDVGRALDALKPRDRDLLWLAYAMGLSHAEMASTLGVKTASVKLLLSRARTRLASLLAPRDAGAVRGRLNESKEHLR